MKINLKAIAITTLALMLCGAVYLYFRDRVIITGKPIGSEVGSVVEGFLETK